MKKEPYILSIDTSADETAAAVTQGRRVLSYVNYTQIQTHREWGGIMPSVAKRAHEERIDFVITQTLKKFGKVTGSESPIESIDYIAVTYGPGLAIALEVGIKKAKELAAEHNKKIIPVNHLEGHIYSSFVQNSKGNPVREFEFPYLALLVSGGHTQLVLFEKHNVFKLLGETRDDAAGEALDKAARLIGLGYPGGPVIERLAEEVKNADEYKFPRPLHKQPIIEFSFSGLKTSFLYFTEKLNEQEKVKSVRNLASSFQEAVIDSLINKTELAIKKYGISRMILGGGVSANMRLRNKLKFLVKKYHGSVYFPPYKYLTGDNAVMIGLAAYFNQERAVAENDFNKIDRVARLQLGQK